MIKYDWIGCKYFLTSLPLEIVIFKIWRRTQVVQGSSLQNCHSPVRIRPTPRISNLKILALYSKRNPRESRPVGTKLSFAGSHPTLKLRETGNPADASVLPGWWNLVDTRDLKSLERIAHAGSSPAPGTTVSYWYIYR